jgi:hypothetical protein
MEERETKRAILFQLAGIIHLVAVPTERAEQPLISTAGAIMKIPLRSARAGGKSAAAAAGDLARKEEEKSFKAEQRDRERERERERERDREIGAARTTLVR